MCVIDVMVFSIFCFAPTATVARSKSVCRTNLIFTLNHIMLTTITSHHNRIIVGCKYFLLILGEKSPLIKKGVQKPPIMKQCNILNVKLQINQNNKIIIYQKKIIFCVTNMNFCFKSTSIHFCIIDINAFYLY